MGTKRETSQIYNTISVLLAEKRTSLAVLRTAIAIFTLPISVFTVLIATSRYYDVSAIMLSNTSDKYRCINFFIFSNLSAMSFARSFSK